MHLLETSCVCQIDSVSVVFYCNFFFLNDRMPKLSKIISKCLNLQYMIQKHHVRVI